MTMPDIHVNDEDFVLHYYGELTTADEARVSGHIEQCRDCHAAYRRLQQTLMAVDETALAAPDLPDGFERTVWARLQPSLESGRGGWLSGLFGSRLTWATAAIAIVVAAFYAGRLSPRAPQPSAAGTVASSANQVRERILLVDLSEHLDRSQRVLIELVSAEGAGGADRAGERDRAEQLVVANRLYRQTAATTGDRSVVDLLDQLERVLVEVAAGSSDQSPHEMDEVRRRIESGSLLFKVRVVSSDLQERQKAAVQRPTGQRSSL
jgi:hypothetical protein